MKLIVKAGRGFIQLILCIEFGWALLNYETLSRVLVYEFSRWHEINKIKRGILKLHETPEERKSWEFGEWKNLHSKRANKHAKINLLRIGFKEKDKCDKCTSCVKIRLAFLQNRIHFLAFSCGSHETRMGTSCVRLS